MIEFSDWDFWNWFYVIFGVACIFLALRILYSMAKEHRYRNKASRWGFNYADVPVEPEVYKRVAELLWDRKASKAVSYYKRKSGFTWGFSQEMVNQIGKELTEHYEATGEKIDYRAKER